MQFSLAISALAIAGMVSSATVERRATAISKVIKDLKVITADATKLNSQLQATDGSDQFTDLDIDSTAEKLIKDIDAAIKVGKTVKKADVTSANAKSIFTSLTDLEPTTKAICLRLQATAPGFSSAGVTDLVTGLVAKIDPRVKTIGNLTLSLAPASYQTKGKKLLAKYIADLKVCTDAYPSTPSSAA